MSELMVVVDGNSLMHRAFHALPPLTNSDGLYTNAVYGFLSMLFKVMQERRPDYLAVAFDLHGPTFRHADYSDYKAGRKPTADELRPQFGLVREALEAMHIRILECPTFEADDILGTMAARCAHSGIQALLVTGDRDSLQLVTDSSHVLFTESGISKTLEYTPALVKEKHGVTPEQIPDLKGLMGDASDNIPGVPGVGKVTAVKLISEYGSVEAALDAADTQLKGKLRERMLCGRASALLSKKIATITRSVPIDDAPQDCPVHDLMDGAPVLEGLELKSLLPRLRALSDMQGEAAADAPAAAPALSFSPAVTLHSREEADAFLAAHDAHALVAVLLGADFSLACTDGACARIEIAQDLLTAGCDPSQAAAMLAALWSGTRPLVLFDAKKWLHTLLNWGIPCDAPVHDVLLQDYLLDPQSRTYPAPESAGALLEKYLKNDAAIREADMLPLYNEIEMPLMYTLLDMERTGFCIRREELETLGTQFHAELETLRAEIYELTGVPGFNILSPKQLGDVLFVQLGLPAGRKTKSGYSTDADTLEGLRDKHPAIEKILSYRQLSKLCGTYIDGFLPLIGRDGRVRTSFDQTAAATGRISSNEPNLQNIPVRTPLGREIRRAFVARESCVLVDADYSQIELRLLAHLSGDEKMIEAFRSGEDIHAHTAAQVYGVPLSDVTGEMRSAAKAVNFGIVYGISDFGLARNIGVTRKEAADFIDRYFARYPGVKRYMEKAVADGKALGYSVTLFGRRRPLPELSSSNFNTRSFGERAAMNTPVQGTAADIIKIAMVRVRQQLAARGLRSKLILQVHDELIVEAPVEEAEAAAGILKAGMENAAVLSVPLTVDVNAGKSWYEAK